MRVLNVSYDLCKPNKDYTTLINRLVALGAKRIMRSEWMLRGNMTAAQLRDDLWRFMDADDRLLVVDVTNAPMAWQNLEVQIKPAFNLP